MSLFIGIPALLLFWGQYTAIGHFLLWNPKFDGMLLCFFLYWRYVKAERRWKQK